MTNSAGYKVVLVFDLEDGMADEELRRSGQPDSFPNLLARQPGFVGMELVKISDFRTMSVQSWTTAEAWWAALEQTKAEANPADRTARPDIVVSREFYAGTIEARKQGGRHGD